MALSVFKSGVFWNFLDIDIINKWYLEAQLELEAKIILLDSFIF